MTVATRNDACSGALGLSGEERTKKIECKMHNRVRSMHTTMHRVRLVASTGPVDLRVQYVHNIMYACK